MKKASLDFESCGSSTFTQSPIDSPLPHPPKPEHPRPWKSRNPINFFKSFKQHLKTSQAGSPKSPKKEYLRCKLIRGCKKCIRHLTQGKNPQKMIRFKKSSDKVKDILDQMITFHQENLETLSDFSKTDTKLSDQTFKSYNSNFCSNFFKNKAVRKIFRFYVKLIFIDSDIQKLQKEFNFTCCFKKEHCADCYEKWNQLKEYIQQEMIQEVVGISPGAASDDWPCRPRELKTEEIENKPNAVESKMIEKEESPEVPKSEFSVLRILDLQPKWIQRFYIMGLHIV